MTYSAFRTTFPSVVGDPSLMTLLEAHHVAVTVEAPSAPWFTLLLTDGFPILLMVGLLVWMGRQAARSQAGVFGFGRNRARRYAEDKPKLVNCLGPYLYPVRREAEPELAAQPAVP